MKITANILGLFPTEYPYIPIVLRSPYPTFFIPFSPLDVSVSWINQCRYSWNISDFKLINSPWRNFKMINKIIGALSLIFSKSLVTRLLPELIKAENTKQPGPEKKRVAAQNITIIIQQHPEHFSCKELNPSVPWPQLIPILIESMVRILNLFFGKFPKIRI